MGTVVARLSSVRLPLKLNSMVCRLLLCSIAWEIAVLLRTLTNEVKLLTNLRRGLAETVRFLVLRVLRP